MPRIYKRVLWTLFWMLIASALWALDVEATYEPNVRRGIPADFKLRYPHAVYNWRA